MKLKVLFVVIVFTATIASAGVLDDFNRQDAPTLGPNWTVQYGGAEIFGNTARALGGVQDVNLVTFNGVFANNAFVDVYSVDSNLAYIALDLAFSDLNNNYFIKVQNQGCGGACFNYAAFYYGNNAGGNFFLLNSPFASGRLSASFTGTVATLYIDSNFDGIPDQTYSYDYGVSTGGTGIGLGLYGTAQADNFGSGAIPEPGTLVMFGSGLVGLAGMLRRKLNL
jgi:PEP-CTERM motif